MDNHAPLRRQCVNPDNSLSVIENGVTHPGGFVVDLPGSRCRRDELAAVPQRRRDRGRVADKQRRGRCAGNANRESLMQIFEDMFGGSWSPITGCTRHPSFEQ